MLNKFAKFLLVATSIAPVMLAFGVVAYSEGKTGLAVWQWLVYAAGLTVICLLVLRFAKARIATESVSLKAVKSADKEVLAFLVTYLLPILAKETLDYKGSVLTMVYVLAIIAWTVYHSNAFFFNPLLALFGYHFYEVELADGMPSMVITRDVIRTTSKPITAVQLFDYTYLQVT
jgi:hypothetical protein